MNNRKITISLLLVLVIVISLLGGCGGSDANESTGKVLKVMVATVINPEEGDPLNSGGSNDWRFFEMIYDPLVKYGEKGKIEPCLAESWELSENQKEYTFHLRKDVKFSDGTDFNADSVLFNFERWKDVKVFSADLLAVEKIDDYTVKFVFDDIACLSLIELSYPSPYRIIAPSGVDDEGKFKAMIGTGQWMLEDYTVNKEATFVPNPNYYGEKPKLDKVILKLVKDEQAKTMALQSGDVDISLSDLPAESMKIVEQDANLAVFEAPSTMNFYMIMNDQNKFLQEKNVRLALNYGLNKQVIADDLLEGQADPAKGIFTENTPYVTEQNSPGYPYDPEKAKALLEEAGFSDTDGDGIVEKNGEKLSLNLVFQTEEFSAWKTLCEYMQSEYTKIGIEINLNQMESTAYYDAIWANRKFDLVLYRTYEDSWNPHGFISSMFCESGQDPAVTWYDEDLSNACKKVLKVVDEDEKTAMYNDIYTKINGDALTIPIYSPKRAYVYNGEKVIGLEAASTSYEAINWSKVDLK